MDYPRKVIMLLGLVGVAESVDNGQRPRIYSRNSEE